MNQPKPPDENASSPEADDQEPRSSESPEKSEPGPAKEVRSPPGESPEQRPAAEVTEASPADRQPPEPELKQRTGRVLAAFALLVAVAAAAASGYVAWMMQMASRGADTLRADLAGEIGRLDRRSQEFEEKLRAMEGDRRSVGATFDELRGEDQKLADRIDDIQTRTERLAAQESESRAPDWRLAEVEHLLRIANRQATLARDSDAALAALLEADSLLGAIDQPGLQPIRRQLADEILALRSAPKPDVEGLALRLGSLAARVDTLPTAGQDSPEGGTSPDSGQASGWQRLKARIGEFFSSIFSVRRTAGSAAPVLSPEESFFLRRTLQLELQAARIAVLELDASAYRASIAASQRWTEQYFNREDAGVQAFITALAELDDRDIETRIPDISGSLEALMAVDTSELP